MTEQDLTSEERWPTMHRLARDLREAEAPAEMIAKALNGEYDDFHPNADAAAIIELRSDLLAAGLKDMAEKVVDGHYDATTEESKAWAESPEGQEVFAELNGAFGKGGIERTAAKNALRQTNPFANDEGQKLPLKRPEVIAAARDLIKAFGGTDLEVENTGPNKWAARVQIPDGQLYASGTHPDGGHPSPETAVEELARAVTKGKLCPFCTKPMTLGGERRLRVQGICRWKRIGAEWQKGCR